MPLLRLLYLLSIFLLVQRGESSAAVCSGRVFHDLSGNGLFDPGEPGIPGVVLSNGSAVRTTDAAGKFSIEAPDQGFVFVVKPSGWRLPCDAFNRPLFFRRVDSGENMHFPLVPQKEPEAFKVLVTADPQVENETEVAHYEKSITLPMAARKDLAFAVTLGDIVSDQFSLLPKVAAAGAKTGIPWFYLNGNHDLDFSLPAQKMLSAYKKEFGPGTYAWEYADSLFIALDDIRPKEGGGYTGGLDESQFLFLKNLLNAKPSVRRIVLMLHVPLFQNGAFGAETFRSQDRNRLFEILAGRKNLLILSGHTHSQNHYFHSKTDGWKGAVPLHEYNVTAACGSFWSGPPDKEGVPDARMWDGTPPGCAVITFGPEEKVQINYIPSRRDPSEQLSLYLPAAAKAGEAWVSFYANVFNGHEGWKVEYKTGKRPWKAMHRTEGSDPAYVQKFLDQNRQNPPVPWKRFPDPVTCRHLWRAYLPVDLDAGEALIEVRATDPDGRSWTASQRIRLLPK